MATSWDVHTHIRHVVCQFSFYIHKCEKNILWEIYIMSETVTHAGHIYCAINSCSPVVTEGN